MDKRREELNKLRSYTNEIDKELTMILQNLQWDRKHILEHPTMTVCKYDWNHIVLSNKLEEHHRECLLRLNGYTSNDKLLPDPLDVDVSTLIKLNKADISVIIDNASKLEPTFKKGVGSGLLEPLTLERLQCVYSSDERRVIHDAVVSAAPSCHDLTDLALPSTGDADETSKTKSRTEILAELRNMKRRRTKYRVAAKSRNYSDVLRDVIKTQMEHFHGALGDIKIESEPVNTNINKKSEYKDSKGSRDDKVSKEFFRHDHIGTLREHSRGHRRDADSRSRDGNKGTGRKENKDEKQSRDRIEGRYAPNKSTTSRNKDSYQDRTVSRRDDKDYNDRERSIDIEREIHNTDDIDKGRNCLEKYRQRSESKHDKSDRESRRHRSKEKKYVDNRDCNYRSKHERSKDTSRDASDSKKDVKIVREVKKENDSVNRNEGIDTRRGSFSRYNADMVHDKNYKDVMSEDNSHRRYNEEMEKYGPRHSNSGYRRSERSVDTKTDREYRDRDKTNVKVGRDKHKSRRDRSTEAESKRSRTEDKHRLYNEVYLELSNKRNKESEY